MCNTVVCYKTVPPRPSAHSRICSNTHRWMLNDVFTRQQRLLPPSLCRPSSLFVFLPDDLSILCRQRSSPWQHHQSPASKWMIKKRWRGFTGGRYAWHPKSPCSELAKRSKLQLSSKQAPPSFIYFCWNIDACYERFKIMCLPFPLPRHTVF